MTDADDTAALARTDRARAALTRADTVPEVVAIIGQLEAVRSVVQKARLGLEVQNEAAALKIEAERKAGSMLADLPLAGTPRGVSHHATPVTLDELGVPNRSASSRWQTMATLTDEEVAAYIAETTEAGGEVTSAEVLALARYRVKPPAPLAGVNVAGRFPVLYADPPWRYEHPPTRSRAVERNYPTLTVEELAGLELPAADDAVLYLWSPAPKLPEALAVLDAWRFEYRTSMYWVKDRIGMGYYVRQRVEQLLIGRRGSFPVPAPENRPDSVIEAPRQEHSRKPDVVYERIERMYPGVPKLELFARRPRPGWSVWGNEVAS